jgi:hypothetical protein
VPLQAGDQEGSTRIERSPESTSGSRSETREAWVLTRRSVSSSGTVRLFAPVLARNARRAEIARWRSIAWPAASPSVYE